MKKFKINRKVSGVVVGRDISNPVVSFNGVSPPNEDGTYTVHVKYVDDCGCTVDRGYVEGSYPPNDDDYVRNHPLHTGIVELPEQAQAKSKKK